MLLLFQRNEVFELQVDKNATQVFQPFWNSINSGQKAVDLTIPEKKIENIDLNFQIKK